MPDRSVTTSSGHFWSISTSQRCAALLSIPAELPSINVAVYVCVNCQFASRSFVWLRCAGLASHRAHFPLHSVWRPSSEGGKGKTGRNKSEGGENRADREEIETETKAEPGGKKIENRLLKKERASLKKKEELQEKEIKTNFKGNEKNFSCFCTL